MSLKYGKLPATLDSRDLLASRYMAATLPQAKTGYGHARLVKNPWGMLGNDEWGDCAWAGPGHEHMLTSAAAGKQVQFTTEAILNGYRSTGFDPNAGPPGENPTDQGSDVRQVLNYRRTTGLVDSGGSVHKINGYAAVRAGNWAETLQALELFECVGIGIQVPETAQQQFADGEPWSVVKGAEIVGGHYVPIVGRPGIAMLEVVTWGARQKMTRAFFEAYNDETWAILSPEMLAGGKSLEGFDLPTLQRDLQAL